MQKSARITEISTKVTRATFLVHPVPVYRVLDPAWKLGHVIAHTHSPLAK